MHASSSLLQFGLDSQVRKFWKRMFDRMRASEGRVQIREFDRAVASIVHGPADLTAQRSMERGAQVAPMGIISVDWAGNISSFPPSYSASRVQDTEISILGIFISVTFTRSCTAKDSRR